MGFLLVVEVPSNPQFVPPANEKTHKLDVKLRADQLSLIDGDSNEVNAADSRSDMEICRLQVVVVSLLRNTLWWSPSK